jgi:PatG Domain
MDAPELNDLSPSLSPCGDPVPSPGALHSRLVTAAAGAQPCPSCGGSPHANGGPAAVPSFVYAIGRIEPRFPRPSVEKEFAQATATTDTKGLTDRKALQRVLSERQNRYLARQLCWVLTIEGMETYILVPRDPGDLDLLIESIRPAPTPWDLDVVIGTRGPLASPSTCNGLIVPLVAFDQIYSFDRQSLVNAMKRPEKIPAAEFGPAAEEVLERILRMTDNVGAMDRDRALNYLAVRYDAIYAYAAEPYGRNFSLTAVDVAPSALSGTRQVVDVVFTFTHRSTDVKEKTFVRVDVTEEFPFLVTKLSPYYDR